LKEGPQIKFLIDQTVDLARPMVGIELAVKPLPVGRFGRPGGLQKTTEERLSVVVDSSTISIRVTSCRTHGLKSIGENANSSQSVGGQFSLHPSLQLGEISPVKEGVVQSVAFSPDGKTIAAGYSSSGVVVWDVDLNSWQRIAGQIANRNFTRDEWRQYFPEEPYRPTFPDLPVPPEVSANDTNTPAAPSK